MGVCGVLFGVVFVCGGAVGLGAVLGAGCVRITNNRAVCMSIVIRGTIGRGADVFGIRC